jgi:hypothetical protein
LGEAPGVAIADLAELEFFVGLGVFFVGDVMDFHFGEAEAAEVPLAVDHVVEVVALGGVGGLVVAIEAFDQVLVFAGVFPGEDFGFGPEAGFVRLRKLATCRI